MKHKLKIVVLALAMSFIPACEPGTQFGAVTKYGSVQTNADGSYTIVTAPKAKAVKVKKAKVTPEK